jgi:dolichyl-phosphate beta-glucosyltransferase
MTLSIVIPLYNEDHRFTKTASHIEEFLVNQKLFEKIDLIFVNDGSTDGTLENIKKFSEKHNARVLSYEKNKGKGHAIRVGMDAAAGDYALFIDADMSTEPREIEKFISEMKRNTPVVIGSRHSKGSRVLVSQPLHRTIMGMVFTALANISMGMRIPDFTCGFKCFSRQAREEIFSRSLIDRWSFDAELLFLAKLRGLEITAIPVIWKNDSITTVRLGRDVIESLFDLIKIRWNNALGRYE